METLGGFTKMDLNEFLQFMIGTPVIRDITHIQNHHTLIPSYRNFNNTNHFAKMQAMEADHIARGFGGIAQHITTFPDGTIVMGRNLNSKPTCIKLANSGGVCIENFGNFDTGRDQMTAAQQQTIIKVNAMLCFRFNLTPGLQTIVYHHWFRMSDGFRDGGKNDNDHKSCPGTAFFGGNTETNFSNNLLPLIVAELNSLTNTASQPSPAVTLGIVQARILNVRTGPSAMFPIVGKLKENDRVSIIESNGEWDRIGPSKWVNSNFISLQ